MHRCDVFIFWSPAPLRGWGLGLVPPNRGREGRFPEEGPGGATRGWGRRARQGGPQMASVLVSCAALTNCHKMTRVCLCMCSVAQSWPTLCDPINCSPPGSCVHGIPQNSGVGCHFLLQGDLPDLGIEPMHTASQVDSLPLSSVQSVSRV